MAGAPLTGNWLSESKVPMAQRRTRPPLGAFGLTQLKCVKSGPCLGAPIKDSAWCFVRLSEADATGPPMMSRQAKVAPKLQFRPMLCHILPERQLRGAKLAPRFDATMTGRGLTAKLILVHSPAGGRKQRILPARLNAV